MKKLVQDHPERVDVRARVHLLAFDLLGRHVRGSADHAAGRRQTVLVVDELGDAEVEDLGFAAIGDEDVVRLQVAVNNPVVMRNTYR